MSAKKDLRRIVKQSLVQNSQQAVCEKYLEWDIFLQANIIHCFLSLSTEFDTTTILENCYRLGKTVVVPIFTKETTNIELGILKESDDLTLGDFGVRQPSQVVPTIHAKEVDLWFIPGLAFDLSGHRLGYGKGYYDRLLSHIQKPLVGLCLESQIVEHVPTDSFDVSMNFLMTEKRLIHLELR